MIETQTIRRSRAEFADSSVEEGGFELSVPLRGCNSSRPPPFDLLAPHLSVKETDVL